MVTSLLSSFLVFPDFLNVQTCNLEPQQTLCQITSLRQFIRLCTALSEATNGFTQLFLHMQLGAHFYRWWHTIILIDPIRVLNKQGLWGVRVRLLPYPGLLGLHIQLADLHKRQDKKKVNERGYLLHFENLTTGGILLTYPVWYEMVETQAIGVCVILPSIPFVVDLRELKSYKQHENGYMIKAFPASVKDFD